MNPIKQYEGQTIEQLRTRLAEEKDSTNIQELTKILNAHLQKKDVIRKSELSDLQDKIQRQMERRITERGDCFSNKDLLDYFKVVEDTVNKIDAPSGNVLPQFSVTNQQVNINLDKPSMTTEEKSQVVDAVKAILQRAYNESSNKANTEIIKGDYKDTNDNESNQSENL